MPRRDRRRLIALGALALTAASRGDLRAQEVVQLEGGGNSGAGGYGAALRFWTADRGSGWLGIGFRERLHLAFLSQVAAGSDSVAMGSAYQRLPLAGDPGGGATLATRGVTWQHDAHGSAWSAFAGVAGLGAGAPYVSTTTADRPLALVRADTRLTPTLRLVGLAGVSRRQTFLPGVVYRPMRSSQSVAVTGGVGADEPYGAVAWSYDTPHLRAAASWAEFTPGFRRVDAPSAAGVAEPYRENVSATYDVRRTLRVTAGRQSYFVPASGTTRAGRAVVDRIIAAGELWTWAYSVGLFDSHGDGRAHSLSTYSRLEMGRNRRLGGGASYFTTTSPGFPSERTVSLEARERFSFDVDLLQVVTHSSSGTSVAAGGRVDFGPVAVNVDYTTLYVPLRRPDPFLRMVTVGLSLRHGSASTSISTVLDPEGRVSYGASGSTYLYAGQELAVATPVVVRLQRYVVRGVVRDTAGAPIDGAALRIGGEIVVTDSRGAFLLRTDRPDALPFAPAFEEFLLPGTFELVSGPDRVTPTHEEGAATVTVVLRRVRRTPR